MNTTRMEAFSDGVLAILITIMVLELKVPHGGDLHALRPVLDVLLAYVLSFVFLGIYWNNHHHLLQMTSSINGVILWANLHLLFWLSLVPFVTGWMGEEHAAPWPTAAYGVVLFFSAVAFTLLQRTIIAHQGPHSKLKAAVGRDLKGYLSLLLYLVGIPLAFLNEWLSRAMYITVALMWLVPDRRLEAQLREPGGPEG